ncbi:MAG: hypothetical protein NT166_20430 [Candidatus Aminicenantes bacterium]|nr:hypothetical protein [Candidatus Aminicenantes bacterium]
MRLRFNVLCFEDDKKYADEILEYLEGYLEDQGYSLNPIGIHKDGEPLGKYIEDINARKKDIDLILMDFQLAGGKNGDALIAEIRTHRILTDIIIYSQDSDFLKKIKTQLDGVYITHREGLRQKVVDVADHILKKELDLSNLRGLVMSETCEFDELMDQIILTFLENTFFINPSKEKESIKEKACYNLTKRLKKLDKIKIELDPPGATLKLLSNLESAWKARTLMDLLDKFIEKTDEVALNGTKYQVIAEKLSPGNKFEYEKYLEEVLRDRNKLGHLKESTDENGKKILKPTREGQEGFEFDEKKALEIRKNLKKYSEILKGIYETISGEKWE